MGGDLGSCHLQPLPELSPLSSHVIPCLYHLALSISHLGTLIMQNSSTLISFLISSGVGISQLFHVLAMRPWRSHLTFLSLFLELPNSFVSHLVVTKSQKGTPEYDESPQALPSSHFLPRLPHLPGPRLPWRCYLGCRGLRRIPGGTHRRR